MISGDYKKIITMSPISHVKYNDINRHKTLFSKLFSHSYNSELNLFISHSSQSNSNGSCNNNHNNNKSHYGQKRKPIFIDALSSSMMLFIVSLILCQPLSAAEPIQTDDSNHYQQPYTSSAPDHYPHRNNNNRRGSPNYSLASTELQQYRQQPQSTSVQSINPLLSFNYPRPLKQQQARLMIDDKPNYNAHHGYDRQFHRSNQQDQQEQEQQQQQHHHQQQPYLVTAHNQHHRDHTHSHRASRYDVEPDTILIVGRPIVPSNEPAAAPKKKIFKPNQFQDCPKTGRTVCDQIQSYPSDEIYQVVTAVKKSLSNVGFKLDGLFSDERDNDSEPVIRRPRDAKEQKKLGTGVVVYETKIKYPLIEQQHDGLIIANNSQASNFSRQSNNSVAHDDQQDQVDQTQRQQNNYNSDDRLYYKNKGDYADSQSSTAFEAIGEEPLSSLTASQGSMLDKLLTVNTNNKEDTILSEMDNNYKSYRIKRSEKTSSKNTKESKEKSRSTSNINYTNPLARSLFKRQSNSSGNQVNDPESQANGFASVQVSPLCQVKSIYITPRTALTDKREWKYVVNTPEKDPQVKQIIRVDICEDPLASCSDQISLPFGFVSQCKQKYSKKKLLAINGDNGELEVDTFFIPSCCVCQLIRDPDASERKSAS